MNSEEPPVISLKDVSKAFGEKKVLQKVSFQVAKGQALCLLGRSGTGKSVTLKLIIGLIKADEGAVCVENEDVGKIGRESLSRARRKMGFLFQSAALFDSFSLYNNLALPLHRFYPKKTKQEIDEIVQDKLKAVGLQNDRNKMPVELSGGMQKRAGLARALICDPGILLVDEPSSGLDRITASEIDNLLLGLKEKDKTSMVIVTHDVRGARSVGDRLAVLDNGKLVACGTAEELENSDNKLVRELVSES